MPGLTSAEAAARRVEFGPNEPVSVHRLTAAAQVLRLFANPLVIILLVASAISAALGQRVDASIIAVVVLLGVAINAWQSYRSGQAAERLKSMVTPTATANRDGTWQEIPIRDVVPGDLIRLSAGDLVPADCRLIESRDLSVQQSALTGESLPAEKSAIPSEPSSARDPGAPDLVFFGTSVVSGTGSASVVATGPRTVIGDIAARVSARQPDTEFERGLRHFSTLILTTTITLVLFITIVDIAFGRNPFESLLFAVALGVGLTPEFLPMISSVTLSAGAVRMAREGVIVKQLPAIQNFGSIDVLCSDKTGTLTTGEMRLDRSLDPAGTPSDRALALAYLNSRLETGIRSPFDRAILADRQLDMSGYSKVDEIPFDFERRRLSVVVDVAGSTPGPRMLIAKGAPESVLACSTASEIGGRADAMTDERRHQVGALCDQLGSEGFRVLAVAYRAVPSRSAYTREDESSLVFAGLLTFVDPVLPDAAEALADLKADGVSVKILTGDQDVIASHVCRLVGLGEAAMISGAALDRLDDAALGHVAEQTTVFTRVSPAQKNRIIAALRRRGHVVGFLGDGINDAPSLRSADVGISVTSATDVAREAAGVILTRPGLRVLHQGILEGRRASANMMKYLLMGTSSNFGNMFSMAAASLFLPFLPMLPTQILLNNFLYDLAQVTIPGDNVDPALLKRPGRWDMRVIRNFMIFIGPVSSVFDFLTFYVLLRVFHASQTLFQTGWFVESLATQTLVLFVIRTMGNPLKSRPSAGLTLTTIAIVIVAIALPALPGAGLLGFTPPPASYFPFLTIAVVTYLGLVQVVKQVLVHRMGIAG